MLQRGYYGWFHKCDSIVEVMVPLNNWLGSPLWNLILVGHLEWNLKSISWVDKMEFWRSRVNSPHWTASASCFLWILYDNLYWVLFNFLDEAIIKTRAAIITTYSQITRHVSSWSCCIICLLSLGSLQFLWLSCFFI